MNASRVLIALTLSIVLLPALAQTKPPVAPVREVSDTYFGQTIADPYRWMEKSDPEFVQWLRNEDAYARAVLHSIPGRDKILAD